MWPFKPKRTVQRFAVGEPVFFSFFDYGHVFTGIVRGFDPAKTRPYTIEHVIDGRNTGQFHHSPESVIRSRPVLTTEGSR